MKPNSRTAKRHSQPAGDDLWQWAQHREAAAAEAGPHTAAAAQTTCVVREDVSAGAEIPAPRLTLFLDRCRARIQDSFRRPRTRL